MSDGNRADPLSNGRRGDRWREIAIALVVLGAAFASLGHPMIGHDPTRFVPALVPAEPIPNEDDYPLGRMTLFDQRFVVWLIARNARAFVHEPFSLFDAEACFPARRSLATSEPAITLGLLGAPVELVFGDPVLDFNFVLFALTAIAALAMYLLVRDWTGLPAAALVASIVYAFHAMRMTDITHMFIYDTGWTVLALLFATRLLRRPSWWDAAGLTLAIGLQIPESFYPIWGAVLIAIPFTVWGIWRHGVAVFRPGQVALIVLGTLSFAVLWLAPFLGLREEGALVERAGQNFRPLAWTFPGREGFVGWTMVVLIGVALSPLGRNATPRLPHNPRFALAIGCGLVALFTISGQGPQGGHATPLMRGETFHPFFLLADLVPGFDVVRGPGSSYVAAHAGYAILAGLGASALVRMAPRRAAPLLAIGLVAIAYVDTLRPATLGLTPRIRYAPYPIRPPEPAIAFFAELERLGDSGPLFEVAYNPRHLDAVTSSLLLAAYHDRPTNVCYNATPETKALLPLAREAPRQKALRALAEQGFETILLEDLEDDYLAQPRRRRYERAAAEQPPRVVRVLEEGPRVAYRMRQ